jgi:hypothetical protein
MLFLDVKTLYPVIANSLRSPFDKFNLNLFLAGARWLYSSCSSESKYILKDEREGKGGLTSDTEFPSSSLREYPSSSHFMLARPMDDQRGFQQQRGLGYFKYTVTQLKGYSGELDQ